MNFLDEGDYNDIEEWYGGTYDKETVYTWIYLFTRFEFAVMENKKRNKYVYYYLKIKFLLNPMDKNNVVFREGFCEWEKGKQKFIDDIYSTMQTFMNKHYIVGSLLYTKAGFNKQIERICHKIVATNGL